ncbi:MAG: DUF1549 domain-containing protein [Fuerstiella sp.]|nr:DUF1549 domain-containing protein [Fuerstiella sp.]
MRIVYLAIIPVMIATSGTAAERSASSARTTTEVDRLIYANDPARNIARIDDANFLRRISLDLTGQPATPGEITRFGLNPSSEKRIEAVERLLESPEYGQNWARYWRDAILLRATNVRSGLVRQPFEQWMAENLNSNRPWDQIVEELLTATGQVTDNGATALLFAHEGKPEEVAAEASRLFMGIQVQCANCHDHPWDRWKREEFHELVAFFPRVSVRRDRSTDDRTAFVVASVNGNQRRRRGISQFLLTRLDRNGDEIISKKEAQKSPLRRLFSNDRIMERIDRNGDGKLTLEEIRTAEPPGNNRPGQGSAEHYMPDLENPALEGTRVDPVFFLNDRKIEAGSADLDRRSAAADFVTSRGNQWFAKAIVNRMWAELTGTAFYSPVDDIGPDREASQAAALEALCKGFVKSRYDLKWLLKTIVGTDVYQRTIRTDVEGFAYMEPAVLRSDQLYAVLCQSLGVDGLRLPAEGRRRFDRGDPGRSAIAATFGFDPSTPRDEVVGSIPQALFLMNSPQINQLISERSSDSPIARIRRSVSSDEDAVRELYLTVLGREPTKGELAVCSEVLQDTANASEAMEDVFWALLNSSEFRTKR